VFVFVKTFNDTVCPALILSAVKCVSTPCGNVTVKKLPVLQSIDAVCDVIVIASTLPFTYPSIVWFPLNELSISNLAYELVAATRASTSLCTDSVNVLTALLCDCCDAVKLLIALLCTSCEAVYTFKAVIDTSADAVNEFILDNELSTDAVYVLNLDVSTKSNDNEPVNVSKDVNLISCTCCSTSIDEVYTSNSASLTKVLSRDVLKFSSAVILVLADCVNELYPLLITSCDEVKAFNDYKELSTYDV